MAKMLAFSKMALRNLRPELLLIPLLGWAAGCASPGHPLPPTLHIPRAASGLTVARVGDQVHLHWTNSARTTDGVALKAPLLAEICRAQSGPPARSGCAVVRTLAVTPGAPADASDTLPDSLTRGTAQLLTYEIRLRGSTGRAAEASPAGYTVTGETPARVDDLRALDTPSGALLRWTRVDAPGSGEEVEISRTAEAAADSAKPAVRSTSRGAGGALFSNRSDPATSLLTAGAGDTGGVLDRGAQPGRTYQYTAQRVRTVTLGVHTMELRSAPSSTVTLTLRDSFPPDVPTGLIASPGPGSIDLSWEPAAATPTSQTPVAGYRVYRSEEGSGRWTLLTPQLVPQPAYRDLTVQAGHTYRYRVTAAGSSGQESTPGNEITQPFAP